MCDPPVRPGHGYHVNTECVFYCDGQAMGVIWCNDLARWKPQRPEEFSCDVEKSFSTFSNDSTFYRLLLQQLTKL